MAISNTYLLILGTNEQVKKLATRCICGLWHWGTLIYVNSNEIFGRNGAEYLPELK